NPDLITANASANSVTVLTNNGSGGFVLSASYAVGSGPSPLYSGPSSITAADVNGHGKVDLISANFSTSPLTVFANNGNRRLRAPPSAERGRRAFFGCGGGCQRRWQGGSDQRKFPRRHALSADQQWQRRFCARLLAARKPRYYFGGSSGCQR